MLNSLTVSFDSHLNSIVHSVPQKVCGQTVETQNIVSDQAGLHCLLSWILQKTAPEDCHAHLRPKAELIYFPSFLLWSKFDFSALPKNKGKYSSVFRENRCPPPPKPDYGGNFSHEAVTLKIRSRSPNSNKLLILSNLYRLANSSNGPWDNM